MRGNEWLRAQEQIHPGFLAAAYRQESPDLAYTSENDEQVAVRLAPLAQLHGATITGNVIEKARLELGMRRHKSERKARPAPVVEAGASTVEPDTAARRAATNSAPVPEQRPLPGVESRDSLERATWALNGAVRELLRELRAQRKGVAA